MIPGFVWEVPAKIIRWKDGDTCEVDLDLGWRTSRRREAIRLEHLYCAEMDEPGGPEAKVHAETLLPVNTVVRLRSKKLSQNAEWRPGSQESLSRTLANIELPDGTDFATRMVADGYGRATEHASQGTS